MKWRGLYNEGILFCPNPFFFSGGCCKCDDSSTLLITMYEVLSKVCLKMPQDALLNFQIRESSDTVRCGGTGY